VSLEELTGNLVGLEQRINAYKNRLPETEKQRRRLDDEIATIKNYLELTRNPSSRGGG
jgi:chromosome segregation ATPase